VSRVFLEIVPDNPISAMAEGKTLSIILFAVMIGTGVIAAGKSAEPVRALLAAGSQVMLRIVGFVMELAPFGVFALIAVVTATGGLAAYFSILKLALCVLIGSTFIVVVIHGVVLIRLLGWLSPLSFFRGVSDAILVGFSTSSSSATLPVAIRVAEKNIGVSPSIASTVLPIGATIGMDGAAMYVAILAVFATQAFGIDMSFNDYLIIAITTAVVAMGVAPVPSGSLFVLATVLQVVGVSPAQAAIVIGFILPFDRILDMIRTIPNVTSDLAIATLIARWEGELDIERYRSSGG
jgi:Na+/H+-dicarboxylate symporter